MGVQRVSSDALGLFIWTHICDKARYGTVPPTDPPDARARERPIQFILDLMGTSLQTG